MAKTKYTNEEFIEAVKNSFSISQVLKKLGLSATGSNYKGFKIRAKNLEVDFSHFTGQAHLKGKKNKWTKKIPLEEILVKDSSYQSRESLKKRLIKAKILKYKCYECGLKKWRNKSISLQLEHKNGDNTDNRKENLTLLCPNCHSQTSTFAGRNNKKEKRKRYCQECGKEISYGSKSGLCVKCVKHTVSYNIKNRKVKNRPSIKELLNDVQKLGYAGTGRKYGVSDNSIRKWLN